MKTREQFEKAFNRSRITILAVFVITCANLVSIIANWGDYLSLAYIPAIFLSIGLEQTLIPGEHSHWKQM